MPEVSYGVKLQDGLSGPARSVIESLHAIKSASSGIGAGVANFGAAVSGSAGPVSAFTQRLRDQQGAAAKYSQSIRDRAGDIWKADPRSEGWLAHQQGVFSKAQSAWQAYYDKQAGGGEGEQRGIAGHLSDELFQGVTGANLLAAGIEKGVEFLKEMVQEAINLAVEFGKSVVEAAMFGEKMSFALTRIMGSASAGAAEMKWAKDFAVEFGLDVEQTIGSYKELLQLKFAPDQAREVMLLSADLQALGMSAEKTGSLVKDISRMNVTGKMTSRSVVSLEESGVSPELVMKALEKNLGKTEAQIQDMLNRGKITATEGLKAIEQAALESVGGGQLGDAARAQAATVEGTWNRLKAKLAVTMLDLGEKLLPVLEAKVMPILEKFMAFLDSSQGKKFVEDLASGIASLAEGVASLVQSFAEGTGGMSGFTIVLAAIEAAVKTVIVPFQFLYWVISGICGIVGAAVDALNSLNRAIHDFVANLLGMGSLGGGGGGLSAAGTGLGSDLTAAMADGIEGGRSGVLNAISSLASEAIAAAESLLDIGSPSRVFANLGRQTAKGFELGVNAGAPGAQSAMRSVASPPRALGGGGGNTTTNTFGPASITVPIHVQGAGDPSAVAAEVKRQLVAELGESFDMLRLSYSFG